MAFLSTRPSESSNDELGDTGSISSAPKRYELTDGETSIGRHPDCQIHIDAGAVSRYHAKVVRQRDHFSVFDLGSRNGTFLNGQRLNSGQILREGDRIRISDIELVFHGDSVPEFAAESKMTFSGTNFGVVMVDDDSSSLVAPQVEFEKSGNGLKLRATPEAKLEALLKINRNLSKTLALDEVLPKILDSLFDIFPSADRGFVVMESANGDLQTKWVKTRQSRDETETVRISRTIIRRVMSTGEAILSFDAMEDSRFDSSESIADFSIKSMICAPLSDGEGHRFGAIQIDSTRGRGQFVEEDIDLLAGVATQAGILINNALMHQRALQQREVEQDLKLATDVQKAFLPQAPFHAPGYQVESFYKAANHIGGDYFDYIQLADGRIGLVVADVVGHGVAAAMFMAKLSAETRFCLAGEPDVARAVARLNDRMSRLAVERFVTFLLVVIDPSSDEITIVNAGHMAPIVRIAKTGEITEPGAEESGLPIAIDTGMEYEAVTLPLHPGDVMLMYTDGINEAMDPSDNEFGIERIRKLAAEGGGSVQIKDRIVDAVLKHVGAAPPFDDMCLVVAQRTDRDAEEPPATEPRPQSMDS
ncbi:SpoIIE family protein phosphatase [Roseiconus nitratireducens]|uniref:SpoIIE family protein phosphatase n=1 Tax=Roseiconus nitratireducens TaxID=2605748 RepID=A0A5M6D0I9_9BACT|nr:SpoIIE family protein phosphatase [Roseiconus nitratireducens]KAA5540200.1 SpoIIE family protein phosphatase [Roseiconus nitratireducens]